jgi:hypothetical protein
MVLEGLKTEERPTAVGYFVLDTLRSMFQSGVRPSEPITLRIGLVDPKDLEDAKDEVPLFIPPKGKGVEDLGHLYKLILKVSRGDAEEDD